MAPPKTAIDYAGLLRLPGAKKLLRIYAAQPVTGRKAFLKLLIDVGSKYAETKEKTP